MAQELNHCYFFLFGEPIIGFINDFNTTYLINLIRKGEWFMNLFSYFILFVHLICSHKILSLMWASWKYFYSFPIFLKINMYE